MNLFKAYYAQIIKQDLINKFKLENHQSMPKLTQITLNFGCKNFSIQKFAITVLALEIISLKKSSVTAAKTPNVLLKIQKGQPTGCKVDLKKKEIYVFLTKLNLEILPKLKNFFGFRIGNRHSNFFFRIHSKDLLLEEFERNYPLFTTIPTLDVNVKINSKNEKKVIFLAKSIKTPFIKKSQDFLL